MCCRGPNWTIPRCWLLIITPALFSNTILAPERVVLELIRCSYLMRTVSRDNLKLYRVSISTLLRTQLPWRSLNESDLWANLSTGHPWQIVNPRTDWSQPVRQRGLNSSENDYLASEPKQMYSSWNCLTFSKNATIRFSFYIALFQHRRNRPLTSCTARKKRNKYSKGK